MSASTAEAGETLASSQWSPGGSAASDASSASTGCTTPPQTNKRLQNEIITRIETIAAYLVKERAPAAVQAALGYIQDAYERRVKPGDTEQAIRQLQAVVQNLADKVEKGPYGPKGSYAAAAAAAAAAPAGKSTYSQTRA